MVKVEQFDLAFVNDLPRREKTRWQKLWDAFQEFKRISEEKGTLVPLPLAAKLTDVSHQRLSQLCVDGRLERVTLNGHVFVTEDSLLAWARSERKRGRPLKVPETTGECWKAAREVAKEIAH